MDDKNQSFQPNPTPVVPPQNRGTVQDVVPPPAPTISTLSTARPTVGGVNSEPIPSPYESLDGPDENAVTGSTAVVSTPAPDNAANPLRQASLPEKKKFGFRDTDTNKLLMRVIAGAMVVMLLIFGAGMISSRLSKNRAVDPVSQLEEQEVTSLNNGEASLAVKTSTNTLLVNGNILTTQSLQVTNGSVFGTIAFEGGAEDRTYTLPDASGTFCLDSNNCNYLQTEDITIVQTSLNNSVGDLTLQGTNNQVSVSKNGNVITLSSPQSIGTSSSPTFNSITLSNAGTQNTGIGFGTALDTNLYRGAADQLNTDDALDVAGHLAVGSGASVTADNVITVEETYTANTGGLVGIRANVTTDPTGASSVIMNGGIFDVNTVAGDSNGAFALIGSHGRVDHQGSGTVSLAYGNYGFIGTSASGGAITTAVGSVGQVDNWSASTYTDGIGVVGVVKNAGAGTITNPVALGGQVISEGSGTLATATGLNILNSLIGIGDITTNYGIQISDPIDTGAGTIGTNYGILVSPQTAATTDYGVAIGAADDQTLWISNNADNTTAAAGIAFGLSRDTNLYRSAADTLKTDDSVEITGNVGVGVAPGTYKLNVNTDSSNGYAANFFNDGNNQDRNGIRIQAGADDASGTTYYLDAYDGDGGQVGYLANVAGTFGVTDVSDIRTKTNIEDTNVDAMEVLNGLRVVDFNRLQNPDGPRITGFIAQEVQNIYGQAVTTSSNGYLGVMKEAFIPVLVKGHQEQQKQIDELRSQVASLQGMGSVDGSRFSNLTVTGTATIAKLEVTGVATVSTLIVEGNARIAGNLTIDGHVLGNQSTRGTVVVRAGETEASVTFTKAYGAEPNVILTPTNNFAPSYRVEATETEFTVYFKEPATVDTIMNYQVQQ